MMPWPLDGTGGAYLPLYLTTLLVHAALVGYVVLHFVLPKGRCSNP